MQGAFCKTAGVIRAGTAALAGGAAMGTAGGGGGGGGRGAVALAAFASAASASASSCLFHTAISTSSCASGEFSSYHLRHSSSWCWEIMNSPQKNNICLVASPSLATSSPCICSTPAVTWSKASCQRVDCSSRAVVWCCFSAAKRDWAWACAIWWWCTPQLIWLWSLRQTVLLPDGDGEYVPPRLVGVPDLKPGIAGQRQPPC